MKLISNKLTKGILMLLLMGLAFALPVMAESAPTVVFFDVQGNHGVPAEKILGVISNTQIGAPLNPQTLQADMKAIMELGYFTDVRIKTENFFNGVKVIFDVVENPVFKEIEILGLTKVKPDELKPFFTQKSGEVFNSVTFKTDLSKAIKYCQESKGLFVEPKTKGNFGISADGTVRLELVELKFGKIKIVGLQKTKEIVIRRELSIKEGDIIDYNLLKEDYFKIMRLRLFDSVDMRYEVSSTPGALDFTFDVKEAETGTLSLGVSFAEDSNEMGGLVSYSEANLMGMGQNLALDVNFDLEEDDPSHNVQFSFYEPWLDDKHTSFGLSLWNSDTELDTTIKSWEPGNSNDYTMDLSRTGLSLSFGRPIWKDTTARIKFNFEQNVIDHLYDYSSVVDEDDVPLEKDISTALHSAEFWDNSVNFSLTKDRLKYKDRNFVEGGYQLSADYQVAGKYLGGEFDYHNLLLEGKWFRSLTPNLVWGTRVQGGYLTGDYPDYDSLYIGGMYKLRGFDDRRFYDEVTQGLIGSSYLLANTELRYRMPSNPNFEFVLFYDAGQIRNAENDPTLKSDYGVGFRYNVPFLGLIRIDQAWNSDGEAKVVFSLGEIF